MVNNIRFKEATRNTVSVIGILDTESISSLELNLIEMSNVLDKQSTDLINEVESSIAIQSKLIDQNCLTQVESSLSNISSSLSDTTINSVKKVLDKMNLRISDLEDDFRKKHIEKLNDIANNNNKKNEFIESLKKTNSKAIALFDGYNLKESILNTFINQDSAIMELEKDNMISSAITYVDVSVKKYNEYIDMIQKMIDVIDEIESFKSSCMVAKELLFNYPKDYLMSISPDELSDLIKGRMRRVL